MRLPVPSLHGYRRSMFMKQWQGQLLHSHSETKILPVLDSYTISLILKACAGHGNVRHGTPFHAAAVKKGLEFHACVSNSVMSFYMKCARMDSALGVFHCMANRDSVSWNVVIHGFLDNGACDYGLRMFVEGRGFGFEPNVSTLVLVLQACWKLEAYQEGLCTHGLIIRGGYLSKLPVQNSLLSMYGRFSDLESAELLFEEMGERDVISWSLMVSLHAQSGEAETALRSFREMLVRDCLEPDGLTMVGVLQACGAPGNAEKGRIVHGQVVHRGFETDVFVGNSLVDMYSKCSDVVSAYGIFNGMVQRNIVTWNSMLSGLVRNERYTEALDVFDSMKKAGVAADEVTLVKLLQSSKSLGQMVWCKCLHSVIVRRLFGSNLLVVNTLLDAYAKCGLVGMSAKVFERMGKRNLISWSTMIAGYTQCDMPDKAISIFREMLFAREKPNAATILSLIEACSVSARLDQSKIAHGVAIMSGCANEVEVGTALLDMYAKCGEICTSRKVFDEMPEKNVVSWSAIIRAYGMNGCANEALALLSEMEMKNVKPNRVTMLSVLTACSHGGLVEDGLSLFRGMFSDPSLEPCQEHYSCIIDMLGRAGDLKGAMEVIKKMPVGVEASASAWGALLSACRSYGDRHIVGQAASRVIGLEPLSSSGYLLASNVVAVFGGSREEMARMRVAMKEKGVKVIAGYSLVHVGQRSHRFLARDGSHPQSKEIYSMVENLHSCMKLQYKDFVDCSPGHRLQEATSIAKSVMVQSRGRGSQIHK